MKAQAYFCTIVSIKQHPLSKNQA